MIAEPFKVYDSRNQRIKSNLRVSTKLPACIL